MLKALGCKPYRKKTFFLADGTSVERRIGDAYFEYGGVGGAAPVIFGEKGDSNLLGATTLEALELVLDPFRRELRPMHLPLKKKSPRGLRLRGLRNTAGSDLLSHTVSHTVPSAVSGLTSVFGMGTGVTLIL